MQPWHEVDPHAATAQLGTTPTGFDGGGRCAANDCRRAKRGSSCNWHARPVPVRPLAAPSVRLARWTAAAVPMTALAVVVIGRRVDILTAISEPTFAGVAVTTLGTAILSAAGALVLSIPGAERSPCSGSYRSWPGEYGRLRLSPY
jgi:hypothetical protein